MLEGTLIQERPCSATCSPLYAYYDELLRLLDYGRLAVEQEGAVIEELTRLENYGRSIDEI